MAKSRRKSGGCTHGRFKRKKMGKGYAALRKMPGRPLPVVRTEATATEGSADGETTKPTGAAS